MPFILLCSCSPFVDVRKESTRIGVEFRHDEVEAFVMNLFSQKEDVTPFSK